MSTRNSGRSFKNRVELQNSCLALGHVNTFIPSTLNDWPVYRMERSVKRSRKRAWIWKLMFVLAVLTSVHVLEQSSICTRVIAAQTYSMSGWLFRPSQRKKRRKRAFKKWRFWIRVCKDKLGVGVAEDVYDVFLAIAISVLSTLHVVNNLIASIPYAELKSHKKDSSIQVVPHCRSCHYRLQILLGHMAIRLVKNAKVSVRAITLSPTSWLLAKNGNVVPSNKHPSQVTVDAFKQHKGIPPRLKCLNWQPKWLKHLQSVSENRKEGARKAA